MNQIHNNSTNNWNIEIQMYNTLYRIDGEVTIDWGEQERLKGEASIS